MKFFKINEGQTKKVNERVAGLIAANILTIQRRTASRLNNWFNAYTTRSKKHILLAFSAAIALLLLLGLCMNSYQVHGIKQAAYSASHIGMPSDAPNLKSKDSLTLKK